MTQMPKNIRQIGGREERMKVYLEDYVNTYLNRLQEERQESGTAGMLIGCREEAGLFLGGAVELRQAVVEGNRLQIGDPAWKEAYESLGVYFSGQELCGLFVCEGACRRLRRQALFSLARECFPGQEEVLLYIIAEDGEEILYRITEKTEDRLQGYYCYFERNEAMQDYMMDHLQQRWVEQEELPGINGKVLQKGRKEGMLGDPAETFREKMRQQENEKKKNGHRGMAGLCAMLAIAVLVCSVLLANRHYGGIQMQELLVQLYPEGQGFLQVSGQPEETAERYVSGTIAVEEIRGEIYPTEGTEESDADPSRIEESEAEETSESTSEEASEESLESTSEEEPESMSEEASEGASENASEETSEGLSEGATEDASQGQTLPVSAEVMYVVQAGDSLYSISRRFYGTEKMAEVIKELNGLENADLIKEGQTLMLP